jgi:hypothetical protein
MTSAVSSLTRARIDDGLCTALVGAALCTHDRETAKLNSLTADEQIATLTLIVESAEEVPG